MSGKQGRSKHLLTIILCSIITFNYVRSCHFPVVGKVSTVWAIARLRPGGLPAETCVFDLYVMRVCIMI